jgi:dTDP-glucose pyrophosphorylase
VAWLLERLGPAITDVCLVVDAARAEACFSDALEPHLTDRSLHFRVQPEPVGVGDAVLRARGLVSGAFTVAMGDGFYAASLAPALEAWTRSGLDGGLLVEPRRRGAGEAAGWVRVRDGRVLEVFKAEDPGLADLRVAGVAILPAAALVIDPPEPSERTGELELEQIVTRLIETGMEFRAVPYAGWRRNVNHPKDLDRIRRRLARSAHVETADPGPNDELNGSSR